MKTWLLTQTQQALNRYLALDPTTPERLRSLENKIVSIELLPLELRFFLSVTNQEIILIETCEQNPDASLQGTPLRLMALALAPHEQRKRFFADDIKLTGDLELAQQVLALFDELEIDWEEQASKWVGDVFAYRFGGALTKLKQWTGQTNENMVTNLDEYIHEEIPLCPPVEAIKDFYQDVDELRAQTDRLEARIKLLQHSLRTVS